MQGLSLRTQFSCKDSVSPRSPRLGLPHGKADMSVETEIIELPKVVTPQGDQGSD